MITQSKETQAELTPDSALQLLIDGNKRFEDRKRMNRDLNLQVTKTSTGQFPFAVVLGCIDSRVPIELVFDLGIGDVFSARLAGNVVNEDVLGSMEYGCDVAGSKVVVVLGHTKCGAVTAATTDFDRGNITPLLNKIRPAVETVKAQNIEMDADGIELVVEQNVKDGVEQIRKESAILARLESEGKIKIVGAVYSVSTGNVKFL